MLILAGVAFSTIAHAQQPVTPQPVATPPVDSASAPAMAFQGATVIDVQTGRRLPDQTIVVIGNRIRAVGLASRVPMPAGTRMIPAHGTFVIPGLWDMHVHVLGFPNTFFPLFLANGVTGVRDMATPFLDSMVLWRREIKDGRRVGPRIVTAGPSVTNRKRVAGFRKEIGTRIAAHQVGADTPEEGRRIVDSLKQGGADLIKVYDGLDREVFFAVAAEARRVGLPLAGHAPAAAVIPITQASDSGLHSIEHGFYETRVCLDTIPDIKQCRALAAHLRRNDTWVMPGPGGCGGCQLPSARDLGRYWPDSLYDPFERNPLGTPHEPQSSPISLRDWADRSHSSQWYRIQIDAGMRFLAGTDVAPYGFTAALRPGFALHDLLSEFVLQGMTPLEALQSATLNPARYFHATDSMGTIAPGKVADLVFLDADPLVDIFNTRRVRAVVADGRFYDRPDLDSLLLGVERLAQRSRRP